MFLLRSLLSVVSYIFLSFRCSFSGACFGFFRFISFRVNLVRYFFFGRRPVPMKPSPSRLPFACRSC